ncbi:hypothetical protein N665_0032s0026 [Sinapis alba]|nr:hypothetical protein N665_0032s0026 [Sinapis alba]
MHGESKPSSTYAFLSIQKVHNHEFEVKLTSDSTSPKSSWFF